MPQTDKTDGFHEWDIY